MKIIVKSLNTFLSLSHILLPFQTSVGHLFFFSSIFLSSFSNSSYYLHLYHSFFLSISICSIKFVLGFRHCLFLDFPISMPSLIPNKSFMPIEEYEIQKMIRELKKREVFTKYNNQKRLKYYQPLFVNR